MGALDEFEFEVSSTLDIVFARLSDDMIPADVQGDVALYFRFGEKMVFEESKDSTIPATDGETEVTFNRLQIVDHNSQSIRQFDLLAVDRDSLYETLTIHVGALAAAAYIQGRIDQINDTEGNNDIRFIRSKGLRQVLEHAAGSSLGEGVALAGIDSYVALFNCHRKTTKNSGSTMKLDDQVMHGPEEIK